MRLIQMHMDLQRSTLSAMASQGGAKASNIATGYTRALHNRNEAVRSDASSGPAAAAKTARNERRPCPRYKSRALAEGGHCRSLPQG